MSNTGRTIILIFCVLFCIACKTNDEIRFAFVTDVHIGRDKCDEDLKNTVDDINSMKDVDFVVVTGDIANFGADEELQQAKSILDKLNKKWYILPGNHDTKWSESGCSSFKRIFGTEHFEFKYGKYHFIGCGSGPEMRMGPGMVPYSEVLWLDSVMAKTAGEPVIYLNHYPINETLANWYKIIDILKKGNTQAILCGHGHKNQLLNFEGIPGVMGRANVRGKDETGGYNLVTVKSDSIFFAERTPGVETHEIWNRVSLKNPVADDESYPRPSYDINQKYPEVKELWSLQDSSDIVSGMAVTDSFCFYTNTRGEIVALNINSGNLLWKYQTAGKIFSTPAYSNKMLVTASTDGSVYCLDASSGKLIWKDVTSKPIVASPVIDEEVVYMGSSEGKMSALSLADGTLIWENTTLQGFIETQPLVDDIHIYFGTWGGYFYALNKADGTIDWQWKSKKGQLYSPAACTPVSAHGKIFIVDPERYTTAFDAVSGKQIWRSNQYEGRESIGISEDKSLIYVKTMRDSVVALSTAANECKLEWAVNCEFGFELDPASAVEKEGVVFVPCDNGCIYALDQNSGQIIWVRKLSNALINPIYPLGNSQLLASTMDGKIIRLEYK